MQHLTPSSLSTVICRFYAEELRSLAHLSEEITNSHPEAQVKFKAAIASAMEDLPRLYPISENQVEAVLTWIRSRRDKPLSASESFMQLKSSAETDLAKIFGEENAKTLSLYLLFFREITARFLRAEPVIYTLKTNHAAYQKVFGGIAEQVFDHYQIHPCILSIYSASFADAFNSADRAVLKSLALQGRILDAGGGSGGFGLALDECEIPMRAYDILDLPEAILMLSDSRKLFFDRVTFKKRLIAGNFFEANLLNPEFLSTNAGTYDSIVLTWILHDWNDELCAKILKNLKPLLKKDGRLIIVERIKNTASHPFSAIYEFIMLLLAAGIERTLKEYDELLASTGFVRESHMNVPGSRDFLIYSLK